MHAFGYEYNHECTRMKVTAQECVDPDCGCAKPELVAVRPLPMRVNLRARGLDRAGWLVIRETQSRRDLTKVAQYEVLG